jgi:hypothetical protein
VGRTASRKDYKRKKIRALLSFLSCGKFLDQYRVRLLVVILVSCSTAAVYSQEIIKGIVVDSASFAPLPYVNVQVKSKSGGTTTDLQGDFSLFATKQDTLIFSLVGYERVELPLFDYEAGIVRLSERATMLKSITIDDSRLGANYYEGMFDEQNEKLKARIPFYFSKARKDKIKAGRWREENLRIKTYVDVVINNPETKAGFLRKYALSENEYYSILARFNETHYNVMYYLTEAELISLLNRFFESER